MPKNIGKIDRYLRLALGITCLILWFFDPSNLIFLVGLIPILTASVNFCPLYQLIGWRTNRPKDPKPRGT